MEVSTFKKESDDFNKVVNNPLSSMKVGFAMVSQCLKAIGIASPNVKLTLEDVAEIVNDPRNKDTYGQVCPPFDSVVLNLTNEPEVNITQGKEEKWMNEMD